MSLNLDEIRKKIDSLDDRIHDLLMERAELIVDVSAAKKKSNTPIVQPAREAKMIRRLLARHRGPLPEAVIVKIWRELVGAVSLLQTGLKVSVSAAPGAPDIWDLAKEYFGSVLPMVRASAAIGAISAVKESDASFAVLPWPQEDEASPWWPHLVNADQNMRIVCAMPYGLTKDQMMGPESRALVVSKTDFSPSGDDRSFIVLQVASPVSRAMIIDVFKSAKLEILSITTRKFPSVMYLIEVGDFVAFGDDRLKVIADKVGDSGARLTVIGGYPVPPIYKETNKNESGVAITNIKAEV